MTVTGTASDLESGLATVELSTDGTTFTTVTLTGGQFTKDFSVPAVQASPFVVTARATDVGGLQSTTTLSLTADRVGPSIAITTPAADGTCGATSCSGALVSVATGATYSMSGTITDPSGVASASLRILDGSAVLVSATPLTLGAGGVWTYDWSSLPNVNGRAYVVEVTATDVAGNAAVPVTRTVLVDRVPPTATFTAPAPGGLVNSATVTLAGTAGDGASYGVALAETSLDGTNWTPTTLAVDGSFSASLAVPSVDHVAQTLSLRVTDLFGNAKVFTTSYVADRVAPVLAITAPSADDSCASLTTGCAGAVANATNASYPVSGTLSEGGGVSTVSLAFDVFDPTTSTVVQSSTPAAASPWSATWASLPTGVNGHEYQLRVTATDAAGNSTGKVVRKIWVDNVKPTATALVNNARLVSRTANLVTFSEPMVKTATLSAMAFTPAVTATTLGPDAAGTTYAFTGTDLSGYTSYTLSVGTGASDRAGNPLAAAMSEKFLTQVVNPAYPALLWTPTSGCTPAIPRVTVDLDGRQAVAAACGGTRPPVVVRISGDGTINGPGVIQVEPGAVTWTIGEFRVLPNNATFKSDLTRPLGYRFTVPYTTFSGGLLGYQEFSADTFTWTKADGTTGFDSFFPGLATTMPYFDIDPAHGGVGGTPEVLRIGCMTNSGTLASRVFSGTWATNTVTTISGLVEQNDAAVLTLNGSTNAITYFDHRGSSTVASSTVANAFLHPSGASQRITFDVFGSPVPQTPAYVAWATKTGIGAGTKAGVTVACSQTPTASTPNWLATPTILVSGASAPTALKVATALNTVSFVAAVDLAGSVQVVSTPSSSACSALPAVTVVGTIPNAKDPAVAVDASGVIWVAYVDTTTGTLYLTHF